MPRTASAIKNDYFGWVLANLQSPEIVGYLAGALSWGGMRASDVRQESQPPYRHAAHRFRCNDERSKNSSFVYMFLLFRLLVVISRIAAS